MYGNNIGGPYMMSNNMLYGPIGSSMMRSAPMIRNAGMVNGASMVGSRGRGLSSLLGLGRNVSGAGALSGTSSFNLGELLNGASKALGVVNQAIPIVKEVGPMMNNMRSMLKIASLFKDETDITSVKSSTNSNVISEIESSKESTIIKENSTNSSSTMEKTKINDNEPNFFL